MSKVVIELSFLQGKDSTVISDCRRCQAGLRTLDLYKNGPIPLDVLNGAVDAYAAEYEYGKNGDRAHIMKRKQARKQVTEMFQKIAYYLQSVATEDDIPALLQAGFDVRRPATRRRQILAPAGG